MDQVDGVKAVESVPKKTAAAVKQAAREQRARNVPVYRGLYI